jgi:hypothetical protein
MALDDVAVADNQWLRETPGENQFRLAQSDLNSGKIENRETSRHRGLRETLISRNKCPSCWTLLTPD